MNLGDILSPAQIIPEMQASNRWEAIDELLTNLISTAKIKQEHREQIAAVVKKRESSMSTGIGFGIGIPHASTDLIYEVVGALGRSKKGVNFDALDNQPAWQRQKHAGDMVEPDQRADLGEADVQVADERRSDRADRLILKSHCRTRDEQHTENDPAAVHATFPTERWKTEGFAPSPQDFPAPARPA